MTSRFTCLPAPRRLAWCMTIVLSALAVASPLRAATLHVSAASGSDTFGCGAEGSPCASIQQAVNLSGSGDTILVAEGTYTYSASLDPCSPETAVVCIMGKHLAILGGYPTGSWSQRDPAAHPAVIDGESFQRGVLVQRASPSSPSASLRLEGFTITRGRAGGSVLASEDRRGGGLKAGLVDSITLRDIVFDGNVATGAVTTSNDGGNGAGGGAAISTSPDLPRIEAVLERVEFVDNQALGAQGPARGGLALGGGLFIDHTNLHAVDLVFRNNSATAGTSTGAGLFGGLTADALGGGMAILSDTDGLIEGFSATGNNTAGGLSNGNGGVGAGGAFYLERSSLELRDGEIKENSTDGGNGDKGGLATGGGVTAFASSVIFDRVAIVANHATGGDGTTTKGSVGGGGAYLNRHDAAGVSITVRNSIVAANRIDLGAGGGTVGGGGGGLFLLGNDALIVHSTLAGNILGSSPLAGQALSLVPHPSFFDSTADIRYSIVADHTSLTNVPAVKVQPGCSATFAGGLFAGNDLDTNEASASSGDFFGLGTVMTAGSAGFVSPGSPNYDYHLLASSVAVDQAGASTTELDVDRTFRTAPRDLGADEYCSATTEDLVLSGGVVNNTRTEEACKTISASSYVVGGSGDVLLHAGRTVILGTGFQVANGGTLRIEIGVP